LGVIRGRAISKGVASGEALVSSQPISFLGGVDPLTGVVVDRNHELAGQSVSGKVLVFPHGKGSTVGTYTLYQLAKRGLGPVAIINRVAEPIVAVGAIISGIPLVDKLEADPIAMLKSGQMVLVDGNRGIVEVL
jgi:predicted aconitase with swiveling domain